MERWERPKDQRGGGEVRGVHIYAEELVDASQTGGRARHGVVGWRQAVHVLIPGGRGGKDELDAHADNVQVSKGARVDGDGARGCEDEHDGSPDNGSTEVQQAVRDPRQNVEYHVLLRREDVANIGAVEDVLEGREHLDPDVRSVLGGDVPVGGTLADDLCAGHARPHCEAEKHLPGIEEDDQPGQDGEEGQQELAGDGHHQAQHDQQRRSRLHHGARGLADGEGEDAEQDQDEVLAIVDRPAVRSERADGVGGVERGLDGGNGGGGRLGGAQLRPQAPAIATRDGVGDGRPREGHLVLGGRARKEESSVVHGDRWSGACLGVSDFLLPSVLFCLSVLLTQLLSSKSSRGYETAWRPRQLWGERRGGGRCPRSRGGGGDYEGGGERG